MIYIDTSSLLKLFILDEQSGSVISAIQSETVVVVTPLTELEAVVQLRARRLGGNMGSARYIRTCERLAESMAGEPFVRRPLVSTVFSAAIAQHAVTQVHCRSLDRLHLAAMQELGVRRLMTHDVRQAEAAREMGYEVVMPGIEV
ncbi:MAG: type II toxin-antitoxin system VapC family toxin [Akkermansiaceae bacterium]